MTLNEIAFNIRNLARQGKGSVNDSLTIDQIKFWVHYYRALFIRRDVDKNKFIDRHFEQDLGALKVIVVDSAENNLIDVDDKILRTEVKLPATVRLKDRDGITFIGGLDKRHPMPLISNSMAFWTHYSKYGAKTPKAFILNDYVYIINTLDITHINVRGIFEDPSKVYGFKDANDCDCYTDDMEYPCPADYVASITETIMQKELGFTLETKSDNNQNLVQD